MIASGLERFGCTAVRGKTFLVAFRPSVGNGAITSTLLVSLRDSLNVVDFGGGYSVLSQQESGDDIPFDRVRGVRTGTGFLQSTVHVELVAHIDEVLPNA